MYKEIFPNLRLLGREIRELWIIRKKRATVPEGQGVEMRATLVFCFRCSTRDASTKRICLIIYNSRIFHPNNLKFSEKLLCTCMNNFPNGSFL